jgi:hypothetical protein
MFAWAFAGVYLFLIFTKDNCIRERISSSYHIELTVGIDDFRTSKINSDKDC